MIRKGGHEAVSCLCYPFWRCFDAGCFCHTGNTAYTENICCILKILGCFRIIVEVPEMIYFYCALWIRQKIFKEYGYLLQSYFFCCILCYEIRNWCDKRSLSVWGRNEWTLSTKGLTRSKWRLKWKGRITGIKNRKN